MKQFDRGVPWTQKRALLVVKQAEQLHVDFSKIFRDMDILRENILILYESFEQTLGPLRAALDENVPEENREN